MKTILLLGSGELGKEFAIAAQRLGQTVVACDKYAGAPAMQVADAAEVFDMLDGDALAAAVAKHRPDIIVPEIEAIRKAKGFAIVEENKLKRVPTGFPADSEYAEMLKLKDFYIAKKITEEFLLSDDLLERTLAEFRRTQPFIAILNRAIRYAHEEMQ